jgi:non-homologous end joining protein Ku
MPSDPRATLTIVASDPATQLDEILTRWDDEDYQDQLGHLDDVIEEQIDWLATTVEEKVSLTMSDVRQIAQDLRAAVAAVRNADQQRTDNNTRAGAR